MVHCLRGVLGGWWLLDSGVLGVLVEKGVVLGCIGVVCGILHHFGVVWS